MKYSVFIITELKYSDGVWKVFFDRVFRFRTGEKRGSDISHLLQPQTPPD